MTNFQFIKTIEKPQDTMEGNFFAIHYFIEQTQEGFQSVRLSSDENRELEDLEELKIKFLKEAREFAITRNVVEVDQIILDANKQSINIFLIYIFDAFCDSVMEFAENNQELKDILNRNLSKQITFKCADNSFKEVKIDQILHAYKQAKGDLLQTFLKTIEDKNEV